MVRTEQCDYVGSRQLSNTGTNVTKYRMSQQRFYTNRHDNFEFHKNSARYCQKHEDVSSKVPVIIVGF
jgi:hypothetical protein